MKKISTLAIEGIQIFKQNQLTIGLDLGEDKTNLTPTGLLMELENYFRVARHSTITNGFDSQRIDVFLQTATTGDHPLMSDGEERNRLSD